MAAPSRLYLGSFVSKRMPSSDQNSADSLRVTVFSNGSSDLLLKGASLVTLTLLITTLITCHNENVSFINTKGTIFAPLQGNVTYPPSIKAAADPDILLSLALQTATPCPFPRDFWFVKTKKTSGSTLKGIFKSICAYHGIACMKLPEKLLTMPGTELNFNEEHWPAQIDNYRSLGFEHVSIVDHGIYSPKILQKLNNPLIFTAVREPVDRLISHFYFFHMNYTALSMEGLQSDGKLPDVVLKAVEAYAVEAANLLYIEMGGDLKKSRKIFSGEEEEIDSAYSLASAVVSWYDFIFVQELFEESIIAFAIEYGLNLIDFFTISAKIQTGKYPQRDKFPASTLATIQKYNAIDAEIYKLAKESMETKIQGLREAYKQDQSVHPNFDGLLETYKRVQARVNDVCSIENYREWYKQHGFTDGYERSRKDNGSDPECWTCVGEGFRCVEFTAKQELGF